MNTQPTRRKMYNNNIKIFSQSIKSFVNCITMTELWHSSEDNHPHPHPHCNVVVIST